MRRFWTLPCLLHPGRNLRTAQFCGVVSDLRVRCVVFALRRFNRDDLLRFHISDTPGSASLRLGCHPKGRHRFSDEHRTAAPLHWAELSGVCFPVVLVWHRGKAVRLHVGLKLFLITQND